METSHTVSEEGEVMETVTLHSRVGADGLLKLQVPIKLTNTDVEVVIIVQPIKPVGQESGWAPGFLEETYGSFNDQPLVRGAQTGEDWE